MTDGRFGGAAAGTEQKIRREKAEARLHDLLAAVAKYAAETHNPELEKAVVHELDALEEWLTYEGCYPPDVERWLNEQSGAQEAEPCPLTDEERAAIDEAAQRVLGKGVAFGARAEAWEGRYENAADGLEQCEHCIDEARPASKEEVGRG